MKPEHDFSVIDNDSALSTSWTRFTNHDRVYIAIEMTSGGYADIGLYPSDAARIGAQLMKIATYLEGEK